MILAGNSKILEFVKTNKQISFVLGLIGSPTSANYLARFILKIIPTLKNNNYELSHISNWGSFILCDFTKEIFKINCIYTKLIPVSTYKYPIIAKRPNFFV